MTCGNQKCSSMECTVMKTGLSPWRLHAKRTLDRLLVFVALSAMVGPAAAQMDTTPPVFDFAYVWSPGDSVRVAYNEDLDRTESARPPANAFTVIADGVEIPVSVVDVEPLLPATLMLILETKIHRGQTVTLSYTDPTAGDDAEAIQDLAGNDAASFSNQMVANHSSVLATPVLRASPRGPTSIWLEWDATPGVNSSDIPKYVLEYSDDDQITWNELIDYTGDRASLRYTMHRGLEPETTYYYRISVSTRQPYSSELSEIVTATTEAQPMVIDGLSYTAVLSGPYGIGANLCWTPDGVALSELSGFERGLMYFEFDENSAMPWEDDGTFTFDPFGSSSCDGGSGVGTFVRTHSGLKYFAKLRAMHNGVLVESNTVEVQVFHPSTTLKAQIIAEGFYGIGPDGELVFPDVPKTVSAPFEIAVGFGYRLPVDVTLTEVTGLGVNDFEVTNATVSAPTEGFAFEQFIGYRVVVTPTTYGTDVTVQVKAGAVTGEGTTKTNLASNIFRRKTSSSGKAVAAVRGTPMVSRLEPNYPNPFNSTTQIAYRLATAGPVRLEIFNVLGQSVRTLVDRGPSRWLLPSSLGWP